jgi:phosphomannomutase
VNPTDISTQSRAFKEHLDISELVVKEKADLGVVVDPDVDRLASSAKMVKCLVKNILWWLALIMY